MKKIIIKGLLTSYALALCSFPTHATVATEPSLNNFIQRNYFSYGQFTDVAEAAWFTESVASAYELGLMSGNTDTTFNPSGNLTMAETLVLAYQLNSTYRGLENALPSNSESAQWYQPYVTYALENQIISRGYSSYDEPISRGEFVDILYSSLPSSLFSEKNKIENNEIPDLSFDDTYGTAVYSFYRAGILSGNDQYGTFSPNSPIQRSEVATIILNMVDIEARASFQLEPAPILATELYVHPHQRSLFIGETTTFDIYFTPENTSNQELQWASSNQSVATVADGIVTAHSAGTCTISATTSNGIESSFLLTVEKMESLRILAVTAKPNSVGGTAPFIYFRNDSGKTMKYVHFTVTPYNSVGDVAADSITKKTTTTLTQTGPIESENFANIPNFGYFYQDNQCHFVYKIGEESPHIQYVSSSSNKFVKYSLTPDDYKNVFSSMVSWEPVWYNSTISSIYISKVVIEYMDGTKETINNPTIWSQYL